LKIISKCIMGLGFFMILSIPWALIDIFIVKHITGGLQILGIQLIGGSFLVFLGTKLRDRKLKRELVSTYSIGFGCLGLILSIFFLMEGEKFSVEFWKGIFYLIPTSLLFFTGFYLLIKSKLCPQCNMMNSPKANKCADCNSELLKDQTSSPKSKGDSE